MVSIVDYGMGNLRSVQKGFEKMGHAAKVIRRPHEVLDAKALVLPGVGAFKDCFRNLEGLDLLTPIITSIKAGKPYLGICLGLQILFSESEEFGVTPGLDLVKGRVARFPKNMAAENGAPEKSRMRLKIPHMGWNTITIKKRPPYFEEIEDGSFFYFVHSYYVIPEEESLVAATTHYGIEFVSCIWQDNIVACQFHPEKSQALGLKILKRFAATVS